MKPLFLGLGCCLVMSLVGCQPFAAGLRLWQANRLVADQRYNDALSVYLELESGPAGEEARYNMANVFVHLGEEAAGLAAYQQLHTLASPGLESRVWHNQGILLYRRSDYDQAISAFRQALILEPGREESVYAYEAAWAARQRSLSSQSDRERSAMRQGEGDDFGLFSVSSAALQELFRSGGEQNDGSIIDH